MKSLSKGSNSKKEVTLAAAPLRESSPSPLASVVPSFAADEVMNDITERNNFGWLKQQHAKEQPSPSFVDRMPKARGDTGFSSSNGGYFNEERTRGTAATGIAVVPDKMYQQGRQQARKGGGSSSENNMRNSIAYPIRKAVPDEDDHLNDLLEVLHYCFCTIFLIQYNRVRF